MKIPAEVMREAAVAYENCNDGYDAAWRAAGAVIARWAMEEAAKIAESECKRTAGINADRYWQSHRIMTAICARKDEL